LRGNDLLPLGEHEKAPGKQKPNRKTDPYLEECQGDFQTPSVEKEEKGRARRTMTKHPPFPAKRGNVRPLWNV